MYLSENDLKLSKEYWKQFRSLKEKKSRKKDMTRIIKSGAEDGLMFEFGYPDTPKGGYSVLRDLPIKYQRLISAFKVLAYELSNEETKYILDSNDFLFNQGNGSIRAPIKKISLVNKLSHTGNMNLESPGNFGDFHSLNSLDFLMKFKPLFYKKR